METHLVKVISEGYAYGKCFLRFEDKCFKKENIDPLFEENLLKCAITKACEKIDSQDNFEYLDIQKMIIQDPLLYDGVLKKIKEESISAIEAINSFLDEYKENLLASNSKYLQERIYDLEDVKRRLCNIILDKREKFPDYPIILVVDELMPSDFLEHKKNILGIIAKKAGITAHGAILARSFRIPFVVLDDIDLKSEDLVLIDTRRRSIFINPSLSLIEEIEEHKRKVETLEIVKHPGFLMLANVFGNQDVKEVVDLNIDGVGLYRTEFMFMHDDKPLGYEEQYNIYLEAVKLLKDKYICFRTFDIGDDKQIKYIKTHHKGYLNYINNKDIFETQIKALLNSNIYGNMKIMFPMVETKDEFNYLKKWVLDIKKQINNEYEVQIGMMLETKKALEHIEEFVEADFFSIGTNDLSVDLYKIRRDEIENGIDDYLDDLVYKLKKVVLFCQENKKVLSVCGELAAIPKASRKLMKIGIRNLSVSTSAFKDLNCSIKDFLEND